ncbi:MAG: MBL fold metallo-hydrolase [Gammaproteobacteria bacterium]
MSTVDEIAPEVFRISTYVKRAGLQFNLFLVRDAEPLLYHTLQKALFPETLAAVKSLIDVTQLHWIGFSHFEADECGALNRWLEVAPQATAFCGTVAAATCLNDYSIRAPRVLADAAAFTTGRHTFRFLSTPYVPHNWESSLLYDETAHTLFTSDVLLQRGERPAVAGDVLEHAVEDFEKGQQGPFHDSMPYTRTTPGIFARLEALQPETLAVMHGAAFQGDGAAVLRGFERELRRMVGRPADQR